MTYVVCPFCMTKNPIKKEPRYLGCWKCNFSSKIEDFIPSELYDITRPELFKEYKEKALEILNFK